MNRTCAHSPTSHHTQRWDTNGPIRRNDSPCQSVCEWCDEPIERAHAQSTVWFVREPFVPRDGPSL